jgi:hypothetical protein
MNENDIEKRTEDWFKHTQNWKLEEYIYFCGVLMGAITELMHDNIGVYGIFIRIISDAIEKTNKERSD